MKVMKNESEGEGNSPSLEGVAGQRPDGAASIDEMVYVPKKKLLEMPYNQKLKPRSSVFRKSGNMAEVLFWNQVKNKQINGLDFDRQKVIGNYIVDFYCHQKQLIVEIDGSSHDNKF